MEGNKGERRERRKGGVSSSALRLFESESRCPQTKEVFSGEAGVAVPPRDSGAQK